MESLTLVRRVEQGAAEEAARLVTLGATEFAMSARAGGCFLLEDVVGDPSAAPAGLAVFDLDRPARTAKLRRLDLAPGYSSEKLIAGAVMLLMAEGFESIET
jgi:hypothetical protein